MASMADSEGRMGGTRRRRAEATAEPRDLGVEPSEVSSANESRKLVRELALRMREKRLISERLSSDRVIPSDWELWKRSKVKVYRRLLRENWEQMSSLQLWGSPLRHIQDHFGNGVKSYFDFLRFLVLLNFLTFTLILGFIVVPDILLRTPTPTPPSDGVVEVYNCSVYNPQHLGLVSFYQYVLDIVSGTGILELSHLFYGHYGAEGESEGFGYRTALGYLLTTVSYTFITFVWIVKRALEGVRSGGDAALTAYSHTVFGSWDFCVNGARSVGLQRRTVHRQIRMCLEEERRRKMLAGRTRKERAKVYAVRAVVNAFVALQIGGAFLCVYIATRVSQQSSEEPRHFVVRLLSAYLPSIVIAAANAVLPVVFGALTALEGYSSASAVKLSLVRMMFLRLSSPVMLLYSLWSEITCDGRTETDGNCALCGYNYHKYPCWETRVGQEMYKLFIFDFLILITVLLFIEFPRKILVGVCSWRVVRWCGQQEFLIPENVLDLVYSQTLCWVGAFFCPLLPILNAVKLVIVFYLKKLTLFRNCKPPKRMFRESNSKRLFLTALLFGFLVSCVPFVYSLSSVAPSRACGPFQDQERIWDLVPDSIRTLRSGPRNVLEFLGSVAFLAPLLVFLCVVLYFMVTAANRYNTILNQLQNQLRHEGKAKWLLLEKIGSSKY